eukprot:478162-Pelagomonas_calceolata.AAC.2
MGCTPFMLSAARTSNQIALKLNQDAYMKVHGLLAAQQYICCRAVHELFAAQQYMSCWVLEHAWQEERVLQQHRKGAHVRAPEAAYKALNNYSL